MNNKFQGQMFSPGMNNNFYMPFQYYNMNTKNPNNNMFLQNLMNNNNFVMNYNNGNNFIQFQQNKFNNNNMDNNNNVPNGANMMFNFNNQQ